MHTQDRLLTFLGLLPFGDLAGLTCYTSKQRKTVWFVKSPPTSPASDAQRLQRARFTAAARAWQNLRPQDQADWHLTARRAGLCMHGYDLWVHWQIIRDIQSIRTLERQTGVLLL